MFVADRRRKVSPERELEIVAMRSVDGLTYTEIAAQVGVSRGAVYAICLKHLDPKKYRAKRKQYDRSARARKKPGVKPRLLSTEEVERKREYMRAYEKRRRVQRRAWLEKQKAVPCLDCGGIFPTYCMDFDHRDFGEKRFSIGERYANVSMSDLVAEIAKCDLVCSNCHRIRTHVRGQEWGCR